MRTKTQNLLVAIPCGFDPHHRHSINQNDLNQIPLYGGAKIILLTHYEDSPGAKLADVVLLCGAQESPLDSGNIPIKVALLYVAEVLVLRYTMDDPQNVMDAQDRTSEALAAKML